MATSTEVLRELAGRVHAWRGDNVFIHTGDPRVDETEPFATVELSGREQYGNESTPIADYGPADADTGEGDVTYKLNVLFTAMLRFYGANARSDAESWYVREIGRLGTWRPSTYAYMLADGLQGDYEYEEVAGRFRPVSTIELKLKVTLSYTERYGVVEDQPSPVFVFDDGVTTPDQRRPIRKQPRPISTFDRSFSPDDFG